MTIKEIMSGGKAGIKSADKVMESTYIWQKAIFKHALVRTSDGKQVGEFKRNCGAIPGQKQADTVTVILVSAFICRFYV